MTSEAKIARAIEILEDAGHKWTMDLADAVAARVAVCDGKDSARDIARHVARALKAAA